MTFTQRLARPLLSSIFIAGGLDTVRNPGRVSKLAEPVALPIAERVPGLPTDAETLVRLNGAVQVGAGALLAIGKLPRLSSLALLGSIGLTTLAGHRFWEQQDDAAKATHRVQFLKNAGLAGGLLLAAVDRGGEPSVGWRARRAASAAASRTADLLPVG